MINLLDGDRPVRWQEVRQAINVALGYASMCWEPRPEGVFDSAEAAEAGKALLDVFRKYAESYLREDPDRQETGVGWPN